MILNYLCYQNFIKSFVIVTADFDYNAVPSKTDCSSVFIEAHDIIEMEEIERDLGF
jgi:hypothetical protein